MTNIFLKIFIYTLIPGIDFFYLFDCRLEEKTMSKVLKRISVLLLTLLVVVGLMGCQQTPEKGDEISVTVELFDGTLLYEGTFEIALNSSAEDLLVEYLEPTFETYSFGKMLTALSYQTYSLTPEGQEYISFYVNGESSMVGVSDYLVQADDVLAFKLESWS
ncbi:MAG: hypothetical protein CVV63_00915 [Tenericutes bacterium HGW-Tenericutes-8]|nr:MAG: hypothetical protein CVV63_00915 [Tenericutes bacterium HGW-Tenericutes-8]